MTFSRFIPEAESFCVLCVCGGFGFPFGTASTKRIGLIGRCLVSSGIPFSLWHVGPSPFEENKYNSGKYKGMTFEYLSPSVCWPRKLSARIFFYFWGCIQLCFRLLQRHRHSVVYCYYQGDFINLCTLWLCRLMKIPVVQEACEWWPGTAHDTYFIRWMYRNIMFRWSSGAMPISYLIENRIRSLARLDYPMCRVPVLVDPAENSSQLKSGLSDDSSSSVLLWCGMVDGYKRDVFFLIDAMAQLKSSIGQKSILRIVGPCSEKVRAELLAYASSKDIPAARIDIVGFVSDAELWNYCSQAEALLMPLWDDDRSHTRLPTKLGQYVTAGRPIVTAQIGEMKHVLTYETAMFYPPGDVTGLALSLDRLLTDPALGKRLASRATLEVLPRVDFRSNASRISKWFCQIYSGFRHA